MFSSTAPAPPTGDALSAEAVRRGLGRRLDDASATVEAVMAAGRQLVERDGVLDFNVRELLSLAGVSNRAFYRFFPTKAALVAALADEVYTDMLVTQAAVVAAAPNPVAALEAWIDEAIERARDPRSAARGRVFVAQEVTVREEHPDLFRSVGRALTREVAGILDRGRATGDFRADVSSAQARLIVRLVIATVEHHVFERTVPTPAERDALVDFVLTACR